MLTKIINMITEINPYEEFDENTLLLEDGILDSLTLVALISEIETEFNINIPEEGIVPANFETVNTIVEYIEGLK